MKRPSPDPPTSEGRVLPVRNRVRSARIRRGLSQKELARAVGVSRQTISNIEAGVFVPSVALAMRLARVLGSQVEDLFLLADTGGQEVEAFSPLPLPAGRPTPLALARVRHRWVAYPLAGPDAFQPQVVPADGLAQAPEGGERVRVRLMDDPESLRRTVVVAGCSPALPVWARAAERLRPGLRVLWRYANSEQALQSLARGEVHLAGVHLYDPATGEFNVPFVRRMLPGREVTLVSLGTWEEGLVVRPDNPLTLHRAEDLARPSVTVVNREPGSGARALLEAALRAEGVAPDAVAGFFDRIARSHQEVACAVASGLADAGVSSRGVATLFGLDFVPWRQVRYDLVVVKEYLEEPPVGELLSTLTDRRVRWQLQVLGGYDTTGTGDIVAEIASPENAGFPASKRGA